MIFWSIDGSGRDALRIVASLELLVPLDERVTGPLGTELFAGTGALLAARAGTAALVGAAAAYDEAEVADTMGGPVVPFDAPSPFAREEPPRLSTATSPPSTSTTTTMIARPTRQKRANPRTRDVAFTDILLSMCPARSTRNRHSQWDWREDDDAFWCVPGFH
jgi:hypothetical protein